ncbi:hypothetical protein [Streptomyces sp. NPDC127066]|uniref:hypothetical protein n=1 Tax=Streptomyces sp. NPDC127066 TaxID=3347125 RepID=UPI00364E720B
MPLDAGQPDSTPVNPITAAKRTAPKPVDAVDPESVADPHQARTLSAGVRERGPRGRQHIATHGTAPDSRVFRTNRNGLLHETGYGEVWAKARKDVPSEAETAPPPARHRYGLRHAGVSF